MTPDCSAATVARSFVASEVLHGRSTLLSTAMTQRVMTASEVLTWIAFREPERWSRADPRMKFFVDSWKARHPGKSAPRWLHLGQLLAKADAELLRAIAKNREPVYRSEKMQLAAEANELDRDRRRKLDDAAEQLRQACAAANVTSTGRRPAESGKPPTSDHEVIPATAFSGTFRAIKADGRLLDTQGGATRVVWLSLEFRTDQVVSVWQPIRGIESTAEQSCKPAAKQRPPSDARLYKWYNDRVLAWVPGTPIPSFKSDLKDAKAEFGQENRDRVWKLRQHLAPDEWSVKTPGRKKNAQ